MYMSDSIPPSLRGDVRSSTSLADASSLFRELRHIGSFTVLPNCNFWKDRDASSIINLLLTAILFPAQVRVGSLRTTVPRWQGSYSFNSSRGGHGAPTFFLYAQRGSPKSRMP